MKRRYLYAALLFTAVAPAANAELRASLDNTRIAPGDTVQLALTHDGRSSSQPDLTPLREDFDIIGRSTSSNVQIINGNVSSSTQLQLTLSPKRTGNLTIPSLSWDSDHSAPLTLEVSGNAASAASAGADTNADTSGNDRVFIETEVTPKQPYVQAGVDVTVRLYSAVPLSQASLDFPDSSEAWVRQVGADQTGTQERRGTTYNVITRHYVLFPQRSGTLTIPGPTLSGQIPAGSRHSNGSWDPFSDLLSNSPFSTMLGGTKPIRLHAAPIGLNVRPRPAGAAMNYWLPARSVTLQASWKPSQGEVHAGDPITLDLDLRAQGLTAAQLPDVSTQLGLPPGLKAYPDQPQLKDTPDGDEILGERHQSVALISDQPGRFTIPDLHLTWWNTQTNRPAEVILPGRTLTVEPAAGSSPAVAASAQPKRGTTAHAPSSANDKTAVSSAASDQMGPRGASPWVSPGGAWPWVSLVFGVLWVSTSIAWWRSRRKDAIQPAPREPGTNSAGASAAKAAFRTACRANDPQEARRHLLAWVNAALGPHRIRGLNELANKMHDPSLTPLLRELDRACYAGAEWNGDALSKVLAELPKKQRAPTPVKGELAPLYP